METAKPRASYAPPDDSFERSLPAFTDAERDIVLGFAELRPFAGLTVEQVCGLMGALGEYAIRAGHDATHWVAAFPEVWTHPDAIRRHNSLCLFYWTRHQSWAVLDESDEDPHDRVVPVPDPTRLIFGEATRPGISRHKYTLGMEQLTVDELCRLLGRLARYVAVAQPMPDPKRVLIDGPARLMNGHNHLLSFHRQPFSLEEFASGVRALLSQIHTACPGNVLGPQHGSAEDVDRMFQLARLQMGVTTKAVDRIAKSQPVDRLHALDGLRAFALILGIFFHGAAGYVEGFPEILWPMKEPSSTTLGIVFFVSHMFRMSLFFLIAGFFGRMLIERRGTAAFIRDRRKRILLPLIVGVPVVMMLFAALGGLGFLLNGTTLAELLRLQEEQLNTPAEGATFPWMHLWFLYYLILFYAGALALRKLGTLVDRNGRLTAALDAGVAFCLRGVWGAVILGLPIAAYFYALEGWPSWTGLLAPLALMPQVESLLSYGLPFAIGWLAHRQVDRLLALQERWLQFCLCAVALTVFCLMLGGLTPRWEPYLDDRTLAWFTAAYMAGIWCWIFGLIGLAVRFLADESPGRRYLADASYWMYIVHLPVLAFFAAWWNPLPWHWTIKYPLQIAATMAVLLVSYRYLVRSTFIGATLNGRRYPRAAGQPQSASARLDVT